MLHLTGDEIRAKWFEFFKSKEHLVLPSASLIPENDPTLLLIGAGMAPFKPFFTGKMKPPHPRVVTSQKCVRTGDIENVGRTARHHTFFEMLGNFSFGDYFKQQAIPWAWEFLTKVLEMDPQRLWITIHPTDDEAFTIWTQDVGVNSAHIVRLEDNFWEIGPGPCGPCSEIYFDLGPERGCGSPDCGVECECGRYLEIWNLVFTQFDRDEQGNYTPLAKKNIDTGAGLERIASVLQHKTNNFETDLMFPIIEYIGQLANVSYHSSDRQDVSLKVIADHGRAITFMISDGVLPSNEGRGYVLRRVLRRAIRHGKLLGIDQAFMGSVVQRVVELYGQAYPDLRERADYVRKVVEIEERRFQETLNQGTDILLQQIKQLTEQQQQVLPGDMVFKLYDTFGFPYELTEEILAEHNMTADEQGFQQEMAAQRQRARAARAENERLDMPDLREVIAGELHSDPYNPQTVQTEIVALLVNNEFTQEVGDGDTARVILRATPFYAESGGQIGDSGSIVGETGTMQVLSVHKLPDGSIYHDALVTGGSLRTGDLVSAAIDMNLRTDTARNHTATHLLQKALRVVLGEHVHQAGSLVNSDRLRFDFSHFAAVNEQELQMVERYVNEAILANLPVSTVETDPDSAKALGATALFGEKYGSVVRMVCVGEESKELCGGTHVAASGQIGLFRIVSESGVAAGVRRIEAVTGHKALAYVNEQQQCLGVVAQVLKAPQHDVVSHAEQLVHQLHAVEKELEELKRRLAQNAVHDLVDSAVELHGAKLIVGKVCADSMENLRQAADMVRDRIPSGVIVLGATAGDKVNFVTVVTKDLQTKGLHAGKLIKEIAKVAGGGGGGRPDMAQAGGKNPSKLDEALRTAMALVTEQLKAG